MIFTKITKPILTLIISGLMITTIFLFPTPALADAPICRAPELTIPDSPGAGGDNGAYPGPIVSDSITLPNANAILDLNLSISATHTFVGDLVFTLTHKIGNTVLASTAVISRSLWADSGGSSQPACTGDNMDIILDDEASLTVHHDCNTDKDNPDDPNILAFMDGEAYIPYTHTTGVPGGLYIFDGQLLAGTWELSVNDNFEFDGPGVLHQWCLILNGDAPDLAVNKDDGVSIVAAGETLTYTLTYSVTTRQSGNVMITETLPTNTSLSPDNPPGWHQVGATDQYTYSVGNLAIGSIQTIPFIVVVDDPFPAGAANITNTVEIDDDGANGLDYNPGNNTDTEVTPVGDAPDLQINKADSGATVAEGEAITYTLTYANVGSKGVTGVTITETVPTHTTFNPGASTAGWVCAPDNNASSTCTRNVGPLPGNGAGGSASFIVTVDNPLPEGVTTVTNTVHIGDDGTNGSDFTPADNQDTAITNVNNNPPQFHYVYLPIVLKN